MLYPTNSSAAVSHASGLSTVPAIGCVSVGGAEEGGSTKKRSMIYAFLF